MRRKTLFYKFIIFILLVSFCTACAPHFPLIRKEDRAKVTQEDIDQEKQSKDWVGIPILNAAAFGLMGLGLGVLIGVGQLHQTNKIMPSVLTSGLVGVVGGAAYGFFVGKEYASELATVRAIENKKNLDALLARIQSLNDEVKKLDPKRDKKRIQEIQDEIGNMKAFLDKPKPK